MIIALTRGGRTEALPARTTILQAGDILLAQGRFDRFTRLRSWNTLAIVREAPILHEKLVTNSALAELVTAEKSSLTGQSLRHRTFRERFGLNVLAVRRGDRVRRTRLAEQVLAAGDRLLCRESTGFGGAQGQAEFTDVPLDGRDALPLPARRRSRPAGAGGQLAGRLLAGGKTASGRLDSACWGFSARRKY